MGEVIAPELYAHQSRNPKFSNPQSREFLCSSPYNSLLRSQDFWKLRPIPHYHGLGLKDHFHVHSGSSGFEVPYLDSKNVQHNGSKPPKDSPKGCYFTHSWGPGNRIWPLRKVALLLCRPGRRRANIIHACGLVGGPDSGSCIFGCGPTLPPKWKHPASGLSCLSRTIPEILLWKAHVPVTPIIYRSRG